MLVVQILAWNVEIAYQFLIISDSLINLSVIILLSPLGLLVLHGNCRGVWVIAAGVAGLMSQGVGLALSCECAATIGTGGAGAVDAASSAAEVNLEPVSLLQLGDAS